MIALLLMLATPVRVLDGDTLVVRKTHVRLLGIDAPELSGHCAKGRTCAPGDPLASKAALTADVTGKTLVVHRAGKDRYGRTVADVTVGKDSLSCLQLAAGQALYWSVYDTGSRIAKRCPSVVASAAHH